MMLIKSLIEEDCPSIYAYASAKTARKMLDKHLYLLVLDENDEYYGLLTCRDLINCSNLLIADCVVPKKTVNEEDSLLETLHYMTEKRTEALPVRSHDNEFLGVVSLSQLTRYLLKYTVHLENRLKVESAT
ncbi:MAG: CBS domain-containing protein [Cyclobacteriaceae bacterium]